MVANAVTPTSGTVLTFVGIGAGYLLRTLFGSDHRGTAVLLVVSGLVFGLSALDRHDHAPGPARPRRTTPTARRPARPSATCSRPGRRRAPPDPPRAAAAAMGAMATHRFMYGMCTAMLVMLSRYYFAENAEDALNACLRVVATSGVGYFVAIAGHARGPPSASRIETWVPAMLVTAGVLTLALCAPFQQCGVPGRRASYSASPGRASRSAPTPSSSAIRGRLPGPGLLHLRHAVQRQLRAGRGGRGAAAAAGRQVLPFVLVIIAVGYLLAGAGYA